jgi:hypothetical protein
MEVLKKLVGRRNTVGNEESCYHQHVKCARPSFRPPSLVTSTAFDNDETFAIVAKAMLFRYENEGLSERAAVNATLLTAEEKRAFLEALDLRNTTMHFHDLEDMEDSPVNEIVLRTRAIFGQTLKSMWRESIIIPGYSASPSIRNGELDCDEYRPPLKTPKNRHFSPIRPSSSLSNNTSSSKISLPLNNSKSSGKQRRRRFFPDSDQQPRCRTRIRIDFKLSGTEPVQSLQLDGLSQGAYAPPSPIASTVQ